MKLEEGYTIHYALVSRETGAYEEFTGWILRSCDFHPRDARLRLRRVKLDTNGRDTDGQEWGVGLPLFRAWGAGPSVYCRAATRDGAKAILRSVFPDVRFYGGGPGGREERP